MDEGRAEIHDEDPFRTPLAQRSPLRRFRGRLPAPVTIWTSGSRAESTGLTMSSVLVAEGEPSSVIGLINDTTDLWERIQETETFVVHVLSQGDHRLAERFAGQRPSPGGLFQGLEVEFSDHGPVLAFAETRAFCRLIDTHDVGYHRLVRGEIERLEFSEESDPLVHFRGRYRRLSPED